MSRHRVTSASCPLLPLKADILSVGINVRYVPEADIRGGAPRGSDDLAPAGEAAPSGDALFYSDRPNRSPWIAQFEPDGAPRPLGDDTTADVVIVGAGIAGSRPRSSPLRECPGRVLLVERDRVARGATGQNAGQLTTYFERPLSEIAERSARNSSARPSAASKTPTNCST